MTKTKLNIESWNRKEHFRFFSAFDDPFFGITTNVDFTTIYLEAKHDSQSFFLYSLHHILTKANETDEFKLRIEGENSVVKYDTIHVSPTIGREDGTFGFAFFGFDVYRQSDFGNVLKNGNTNPLKNGKHQSEKISFCGGVFLCVK